MAKKKTLNWGILATGNIARTMAEALKAVPEANLIAVASRSLDRARDFAARWGIPHAYGSYEELVRNPDVDVVYIATPHPYHAENIQMCLNAGKHVLCEKPLTLNAREAKQVIALARKRDLYLLEGVWMRFIPGIVRVRELIEGGVLGDILLVHAHFNMALSSDPNDRILNPKLGGGGLLDVGIYPLNFAVMLLGSPENYTSHAQIGTTGVDVQATMLLKYPNGVSALLSSGVTADMPNEATIKGTNGYIVIHENFWHPTRLTLKQHDSPPEIINIPYESTGLNYEAQAVCRDILAGQRENQQMPLSTSLAVIEIMDNLRATWGIRYPTEL